MTDISKMLAEAERWREKINNKVQSKAWFSVVNKADRATIRIYDEISMWGVDAQAFTQALDEIEANEIEVCINSPGGSVFDGLAIYNSLRTHPARIITRVDGVAASAASFIVQAGDERVMVENAQMMIHEAWGVAVGNASEHREFADFLEAQTGAIAELYASAAGDGFDADHFTGLMSAETWLNAAETVENGLADRVLTPERQSAPDADEASNKMSTETPDASAAESAAESPAVDVVHLTDSEFSEAVRALSDIA